MIIADIFPERLLSNIKNTKIQIFQSATLFDLKITRKLFGLNTSTQLLNLNSNPFKVRNNYGTNNIGQYSNQLRCWLTLTSTRKKERNELLFTKISNIISSIHQISPRHTLVLCPSYDFIEKLIKFMNIPNIIVEHSDSSLKKLNENIFSLTDPGIIIANQRGKIREGNEWVINGKSLVSTVILAGLATYVPSGDKFVERIIRNQFRRKLGTNSSANLFQYNLPLVTNVIQSYGRSIRSSGDRGALVVIDKRAEKMLHNELAMRRYRSVGKLKSDLSSFFEGYPSIDELKNGS